MSDARGSSALRHGGGVEHVPDDVLTAQTGIRRVELRVPFTTGTVNGWLVPGEDLALVDAGVNTASNLLRLRQALAGMDARLEDIDALVLTHHDIDHVGLGESLAELAEPRVIAHWGVAGHLDEFERSHSTETEFVVSALIENGVPDQAAWYQYSHGMLESGYGSGLVVTESVHHGGTCRFAGASWEVEHLPGHSAWDTCFVRSFQDVVFSGDVLLLEGPSIPYFSSYAEQQLGRLKDGGPRRTSAGRMLHALDEMCSHDPAIILPGHGKAFVGAADLCSRHTEAIEGRMDSLVERVRGRGVSAYEVMRERWGERIAHDFPQRVSRLVGELEILIDHGRVHRELTDGVDLYG